MKRVLAGVSLALIAGLLAGAAGSAGEKKDAPGVREIDVKGVSFPRERGSVKAPIVIENEKDLVKNLEGAKDLQDKLKGVDFSKEYVLVFAWSGSGGDRLTFGSIVKTDDKSEARFAFAPGLTRDLRMHLSVFAVTKGTTWAVQTGKPKIKIKIIMP